MSDRAVFVSVARFARLVGLSERTCWSLIRNHRLPVHRVGRRTLVKAEEGFRAIERAAERQSGGDPRHSRR